MQVSPQWQSSPQRPWLIAVAVDLSVLEAAVVVVHDGTMAGCTVLLLLLLVVVVVLCSPIEYHISTYRT
jgi:hypothetical protein